MRTLTALFLLVAAPCSAADSILKCTFVRDALLMREASGPVEVKSGTSQFETIFSGLDSDSPRFKGEGGEEKLRVLRREPDEVWLAEYPPLGGVNVYALFLQSRTVILTKAYTMHDDCLLGSPPSPQAENFLDHRLSAS
jgi:hypothetical protein